MPEAAVPSPEHRLYENLAESDPDSAHSRYNALVRRLISFENAAECAGLGGCKTGAFLKAALREVEISEATLDSIKAQVKAKE